MELELVDENYFKKEDGTFDLDEAIKFTGRVAGICYNKEGYSKLLEEPEEKSIKRADNTLKNAHHSVAGHAHITLNIKRIPKILAMVINNEKEYNTSEKSGRYTPIDPKQSPIITEKEQELYNKWVEIFKIKIKEKYGDLYSDFKIKTLAQENARYLVTVFMDTEMAYTTSFRQINYLASFMQKYIDECDKNDEFCLKLSQSMQQFIFELERLNLLDERLMQNNKNRSLSLFSKHYDEKEEIYGDVYLAKYSASFAELAQAQRHRTLDYEIRIPEESSYFVPPILLEDETLSSEWVSDIDSVKQLYPQGLLIDIIESGKYEDFILKCEERLCSAAQLEIMLQTRATLLKYQEELKKKNHYLKDDIKNYTKGAACTFKGHVCTSPCNNKEGIKLQRKI